MTAVEPLSAAVQAEVERRVAEAEERAWHRGWAAGWRRCATKIAEAIEADAGSHECAWGFDAAEIARKVGAQAPRPEGRVRRGGRSVRSGTSTGMPTRPAESHAGPRSGRPDPSTHALPHSDEMGDV